MGKRQTSRIILILIALNVEYSFGRPLPCSPNQVAKYNKKGIVECIDIRCPHGRGLTVNATPGKIFPYGTRIACPPCIEGRTFSDRDDKSQCMNCTKCTDNELYTGECLTDKDTIICNGTCNVGYYRRNSKCLPCSKCCGDQNDSKPADCIQDMVPSDERCSVESMNNCVSTTATSKGTISVTKTIIDINTSTASENTEDDGVTLSVPKDHLENSNESSEGTSNKTTVTVVSVLIVVIIAVMIAGLAVYKNKNVIFSRCCQSQRRNAACAYNRVNQNGPETAQQQGIVALTMHYSNSVESTGSSCERSSLSNSSDLISARPTQVALTKHHSNSVESSELSSGPIAAPTQACPSGRGGIPSSVDEEDQFSQTTSSDDQEDTQGGHSPAQQPLSEEEKCSLLVTNIPSALYEEICKLLDKKDNFYQDYRFLASHFGMENSEIDKLESNPTDTVLKSYRKTIKEFLAIENFRQDVIDKVKSWLQSESKVDLS